MSEERPAIVQMMVENREGLGMRVIAVMVQRYGVFPRALWDLNTISDMGAGRGITCNGRLPQVTYESILDNGRYNIFNLTIGGKMSYKLDLPPTLRRLMIAADDYSFPLDLPVNLQELTFQGFNAYHQPLVLPDNLLKLDLGNSYNLPVTLPPGLLEVKLGLSYNCPLLLPRRLKRLVFSLSSGFNHPIALPASLRFIQFGCSYNQPTILPSEIEELRIGPHFTHDVSLPPSLRKIEWCCNRPLHIPDGVLEVVFEYRFNQPVIFPSSLKKAAIKLIRYSHPISFPPGLEELLWRVERYEGLVLPEGLLKLTWASASTVVLPLGLKELIIGGELMIGGGAPLLLHEGLQKVTFACDSQHSYRLPNSVREVVQQSRTVTFTHPTTLRHLTIRQCSQDIDLSHHTIHKLTIGDYYIEIKRWPQGLKELEFTVDNTFHTLRVPKGCRIVGEERPENVIMEE